MMPLLQRKIHAHKVSGILSFLFLILMNSVVLSQDIKLPDKTKAPITDQREAVEIIYYTIFPYKEEYSQAAMHDCSKVYLPGIVKKTTPILQCKEQVSLLRPHKVIRQWLEAQHKNHFFLLNIREFNIINRHAFIINTHSINQKKINQHTFYNKTEYVTGLFKRHVFDKQEYKFKSVETGEISFITSTPQHLFYVKNKKKFIPISDVSPDDDLISKNGQRIKIISPSYHKKHHSTSVKNKIFFTVYNLEIDKRHNYFVGDAQILVHNICVLAKELQKKIPHLLGKGNENLRLKSQQDTEETYNALRGIHGEQVGCDIYSILTTYSHYKMPLCVDLLEKLFEYKSAKDKALFSKTFYDFIKLDKKEITTLSSKGPVATIREMFEILNKNEKHPVIFFAGSHSAVISPSRGHAFGKACVFTPHPDGYIHKIEVREENLSTIFCKEPPDSYACLRKFSATRERYAELLLH